MVTKRALEQWHLLEAASAGLGGRTVMHHHVLCKSSLHARQHFDEVLLRQTGEQGRKRQLLRIKSANFPDNFGLESQYTLEL